MTQEQKDNWVTALRSGKYLQARGSLKMDNGYCCLGLYCEVNSIPFKYNNCLDKNGEVINYDPLNRDIGVNNVNSLIDLNDKFRYNFNEIANWIEENIKPEN